MEKNKLVEKFIAHPQYLKKGAGYLAESFNCTKEVIYEAKAEAREHINAFEHADLQNHISELEGQIIDQRNSAETGESVITVRSNKPLSPSEIDTLCSVDNITRKVTQTWLKSHKNGSWTYSISTMPILKGFDSSDELRAKLLQLFPDQTPFTLPVVSSTSSKSLVIYIGDDHAGMLLENSIFNKTWTEADYESRLLKIVEKVIKFGQTFEEVIIVSLGDQMNGFNQQTTRGGHIVASLSNKDQFDMYTKARIKFYDALFTSGASNNYSVYEVNDSNHAGLGFSYMANEFLRLYVQSKFPQVTLFSNTEDFIVHIDVQGHKILAVHGKDAKDQKNGFPINLDAKTEVYFTDYMLSLGINPKITPVSVVKADLHRFNENQAKSFRYVNVPSIAEGSSWQERNFASSQAGALIEIYESGEIEPLKTIIRF